MSEFADIANLAYIETDRLRLRLLAVDDEELYCELYTVAATMRFIGVPLSHGHAQRSFRKALRLIHHRCLAQSLESPPEQIFLTIVEKTTQQTLGICSIQHFDERRRQAEAGIMLKSAAQARGVAKEAVAALITRGFGIFPVDEIRARISVGHCAAAGVLASIGFVRGGDVMAATEYPGTIFWSAYRESWKANHPPGSTQHHGSGSTKQETGA